MTTFPGFPPQAFEFYADLELDNTREFWAAHRPTWEQAVRAPMTDLLADLSGEFGPGTLFRPYRDVRFSADKSPYKDHQGGYVEIGPACGYYVQVSSGGLMVAGGWYSSQADTVATYRAVVDGPLGAQLEELVASARSDGLAVGGDVLRTRPRGVPADHPRLELLRHRTLTVETSYPNTEPWLATPAALQRVRDGWRQMRPLLEWLADHVTGRSPD